MFRKSIDWFFFRKIKIIKRDWSTKFDLLKTSRIFWVGTVHSNYSCNGCCSVKLNYPRRMTKHYTSNLETCCLFPQHVPRDIIRGASVKHPSSIRFDGCLYERWRPTSPAPPARFNPTTTTQFYLQTTRKQYSYLDLLDTVGFWIKFNEELRCRCGEVYSKTHSGN